MKLQLFLEIIAKRETKSVIQTKKILISKIFETTVTKQIERKKNQIKRNKTEQNQKNGQFFRFCIFLSI